MLRRGSRISVYLNCFITYAAEEMEVLFLTWFNNSLRGRGSVGNEFSYIYLVYLAFAEKNVPQIVRTRILGWRMETKGFPILITYIWFCIKYISTGLLHPIDIS